MFKNALVLVLFFLLSFSCCVEVMNWQSCMAARQCHEVLENFNKKS